MATSCLLDAVNSVLTQMGEIPYDWSAVQGAEKSRPTKLFQLVAMFNNQIAREAQSDKGEDGVKGYVFAKPAIFLEIIPEPSVQLLDNVTLTDFCWKMHIVDFRLNENDESGMDQNLEVYKYRDLVKQYMTNFTPPNCSSMFSTDEKPDYDHTGVYHYVLDFKSCFEDTKASVLDPDQVQVIYKDPPTNLELETEFDDGITPPVDPHTSYIWEVYDVAAEIVTTPDGSTQTLGNGAVIPLQYALNPDGTLTIPYLNSIGGIQVLIASMLIGNAPASTVVFTYNAVEDTYVLDNSAGGGFVVGNNLLFNASLPNI